MALLTLRKNKNRTEKQKLILKKERENPGCFFIPYSALFSALLFSQ